MIIARIHVTLKNGILDPQGKTAHQALDNLGLDHIQEVRMGKLIQLKFDGVSKDEAEKIAQQACSKLLANPVIEDFSVEVFEEKNSQ